MDARRPAAPPRTSRHVIDRIILEGWCNFRASGEASRNRQPGTGMQQQVLVRQDAITSGRAYINYLVSWQSPVEVPVLQGFGAGVRGWPRFQPLDPLKTPVIPSRSPSIVLLSVSVPAELAQAIKALREAEGLTICEWMLKDPRVRKWARTHDVPLPKPGKKRISRDAARWLDLTKDDWNRGNRHVANLLGVSRQAVAWKKKRLRPG